MGEATAKQLTQHFADLSALFAATEEQLLAVPDIGPVVAQHIRAFFAEKHNRVIIEKLLAAGIHWQTVKLAENRPLAGKNICINRYFRAVFS